VTLVGIPLLAVQALGIGVAYLMASPRWPSWWAGLAAGAPPRTGILQLAIGSGW